MQEASPVLYDHARNSPNLAFSQMAVRDGSRSRSASPWVQGGKRNSGGASPMEWESVSVGPRKSGGSGRRTPWQRSPSPADLATTWRRSDSSASPPLVPPSTLSPGLSSRLPRPSAANYEKRMSASLATQLMRTVSSRRNSTVEEAGREDPAQRDAVEAELARQWAYTLGAELAHHVVGVFADPNSSSYNKRWNSEMATRVFGANPWGYLTNHKFFVPPFVCPEVVKNMPKRMKDIHSAVRVVSGIVSTRNDHETR